MSSTELSAYYEAKGKAGFRVLALATRAVVARNYQRHDEAGWSSPGFLLFLDPPKADAARVLGDLATLHVEVKVITGDNRFVTGHLAETVGLNPTSMLTGDALVKLDDEALWHAAPKTSLFAEIDPQQKERIVRALQRTGHSVGYLGDGINDAPALHAADVGISVDQAVDVARGADIILLATSTSCVPGSTAAARLRIRSSTSRLRPARTSATWSVWRSRRRSCRSCRWSRSRSAQQLPLRRAVDGDLDRPRRRRARRTRSAGTSRRSDALHDHVRAGQLHLRSPDLRRATPAVPAGEATFQTTWFVVSLLTELGVVLILRTRGPAWRSRPSALLLWTTVAATGFALAVPFFGSWSTLFGFVPLSTLEMGTVVGMRAYLGATEATKRWFFRPSGATPA